MDFLRKVFAIVITVFVLHPAMQGQAKVTDAFKQSYAIEYEGEYSKAINLLKSIYDEESYEINLRLGWLHYLSGLFSESVPYYEKCLVLKPMSVEARLGLVNPASSMGNWNQVEKRYREILEIDRQNSLVNYRMGVIFYGRENYTNAARFFEKVVNLYPSILIR